MNHEIKIDHFDDETTIDLPPRPVDALRHFGWAAIVVGFVTIVLFIVVFQSKGAILGIVPALALVYVGVCILTQKTRCRIRWRNEILETTEYVGWFKWTRSKNYAFLVNKLVYSSILTEFTEVIARIMPKGLEDLSLELKDNDYLYPLVYWYPRSVLEQITKELVPALEAEYPPNLSDSESAEQSDNKLETDESTTDELDTNPPAEPIDVLEQAEHAVINRKPVDSLVKIETHDQAIVFRIPPKGFWKGSGDLAKVCAVVMSVVAYGTLYNYSAIIQGNSPWWHVFYSVPWLAIGFAFWAFCYARGRSAVTIGASPDSLWIDQTVGLTQNKITEFEKGEIKRITPELCIVDLDDTKHPISTTLDEQELTWIASELVLFLRNEGQKQVLD